jgi:hypothetical protein
MLRALVVAALVGLAGVTGSAQSAPPQPAPGAQRGAPARTPGGEETLPDAELEMALDSYAMFQAQQQLSIADERFGMFAARLKKLQDTRRRNQRQRLRILQELRRLAGPKSPAPGDDASIRAQLTVLREHDARAAAELGAAYDALDEILDPRQQARYRLFEEQIERRKLDLLMKARRSQGR